MTRFVKLTNWSSSRIRAIAYLVSGGPVAVASICVVAVIHLPLVTLVRGSHVELTRAALLVIADFTLVALIGLPSGLALALIERRRIRLMRTSLDLSPQGRRHRGWHAWREEVVVNGWRHIVLLHAVALVGITVLILWCTLVLAIAVALAAPLIVNAGNAVSFGPWQIDTILRSWSLAVSGLVALIFFPAFLKGLAQIQARVTASILVQSPNNTLVLEIQKVKATRTEALMSFDEERRRIERDLHDGAQQRVLALTVQLGLAAMDILPGHPAAQAVAEAQTQAAALMVELRDFIRSVHPPALTQQGLVAALEDLVDTCSIMTTLSVQIGRRLPAHIESTVYFVVAEALTNVVKHASASSCRVDVKMVKHAGAADDTLVVTVTDTGIGGADEHRGTGLTGLARRLALLDGQLFVSSPVGGPTEIKAELPCLA